MNESVKFLDALAVDQKMIDELGQLPFSGTGTRRICLHKSESSPLHVMLVESQAGAAFPSHSHSDSDEFSTVVSGTLELMIWDRGTDNTPRLLRVGAGADLAKATFVPQGIAHITRAIGGNCVYIEVKLGPFLKDSMIFKDSSQLKMP